MFKKNSTYTNTGQSILEYTVFISIIVVAMVFMTPSIKRTMQSLIKVTADQIQPQVESEQNSDNGYLEKSESAFHNQQLEVTKEHGYATQYERATAFKTVNSQESDLGITDN